MSTTTAPGPAPALQEVAPASPRALALAADREQVANRHAAAARDARRTAANEALTPYTRACAQAEAQNHDLAAADARADADWLRGEGVGGESICDRARPGAAPANPRKAAAA